MKESAQMNTETQEISTENKSVMDKVKDYVTNNAVINAKDVEKETGVPRNQISTALWKLVKKGMVIKTGIGLYERIRLTPVNKRKKRKVTKPRTTPNGKEIIKLKTELDHAAGEILHWRNQAHKNEATMNQLRQADQNLQDALAVIRYLEQKLFIAIQLDAKNNGNT